jgi:hypothetical protein
MTPGRRQTNDDARAHLLASLEYGVNPLVGRWTAEPETETDTNQENA